LLITAIWITPYGLEDIHHAVQLLPGDARIKFWQEIIAMRKHQ
jgi:hypothetical protein